MDPNRRSVRPRLELLEGRAVPAGVTATFSPLTHTLTIVGDTLYGLGVRSDPVDPALFDVYADTVNGAQPPWVSPPGVRNITIGLSGSGNHSVQLGYSTNGSPLTATRLPGNLSVTLGASSALGFGARDLSVGGNVTIRYGDGYTTTSFGRDSGGESTVGGNLTITGGTGANVVSLTDTDVGGNVTVNNGHGDARGAAGDIVIQNNYNVGRRSVIRGNLTVTYVEGDGTFGDANDGLSDVEVRGNVTFNHGPGRFKTIIDGLSTPLPVLVRGSLTITGTGANELDVGIPSTLNGGMNVGLGLVVGRNLTVATGAGDDALHLNRLQVGGTTSLLLGDGNNTVAVNNSSFAETFTLTTGSGADVVTIDDSLFTGAVTLTTGAGADGVDVETAAGTTAPTEFQGPVTVSLGAGDDSLTLGQPLAIPGLLVVADSTLVVHHGTGSDRKFIFDGHVDFPFGTSLQWVA